MHRLVPPLVVLSGLLAACGGSSSAPQETPTQLLADGARWLQSESTYHLSGTFTDDATSGSIDAQVTRQGSVAGSLTLASDTAHFVVADRASYFDTLNSFVEGALTPGMVDVVTKLKGQHWWRAPGSTPVTRALDLTDRARFTTIFLTGRSTATQSHVTDSQGRPAIKVSDAEGNVYVAAASPHAVLEVQSSPSFLAGSLTNVVLVLDRFGAPANISPPSTFVTPVDNLMPPFYYLQSFDFAGDCSSSSCPVKAVVQAAAGTGGQATVTFVVADAANKELGRCTANVTLVDVYDSQTATCRAGGAAWTHFYYYVGGSYHVSASVANPDYNS